MRMFSLHISKSNLLLVHQRWHYRFLESEMKGEEAVLFDGSEWKVLGNCFAQIPNFVGMRQTHFF